MKQNINKNEIIDVKPVKRKPFQILHSDENPQFIEDGTRIYLEMKDKYPDKTDEHLDNILNGIIMALDCVIKANVHKDNQIIFIQLIV